MVAPRRQHIGFRSGGEKWTDSGLPQPSPTLSLAAGFKTGPTDIAVPPDPEETP